MTSKNSAVKRSPESPGAGARHARPARATALAPANIEQAADLGAGFIIVKLRDYATAQQASTAKQKRAPLPPVGDIPVMPRSRLVSALRRGGKLAGVEQLNKQPSENAAFMHEMAAQEKARRVQLLAAGQLISAQELSERLDMSTQAISKSLKDGRLFALEGGGNRLCYPSFYADSALSRRDLYAVTKALGAIPPSSKWQFFTTPKASLNGLTPLQALQQGARDAVLVTAAGFVER
ncbi:hypothetical protein FHW83_003265 [Duganella sp. SG902]|uniref:HTH domain-containing protein n=1 Tax=Duganella sp. SG902 TaxID=2587016 RepID=UPI00159E1A60|nr:HTH domain-containing protein [Duganella sp. SG902]NVM77447.1 hypothetical protein [Duganella sp. SG902]